MSRYIQQCKEQFKDVVSFNMQDFYDACPYSMDELRRKNRKQDIKEWRQIGVSWLAMKSFHLSESGYSFNQSHGTVIHSLQSVMDSKRSPRYNPSLYEKIKQVLEGSVSEVPRNEDMNINEMICMVLNENRLSRYITA